MSKGQSRLLTIFLFLAAIGMPVLSFADSRKIIGYVSSFDGESKEFVIERDGGEIKAQYWLDIQDGDRIIVRGPGTIDIKLRGESDPVKISRETSPKRMTASAGWAELLPAGLEWVRQLLTDGSDRIEAESDTVETRIRSPMVMPLSMPLFHGGNAQKILIGPRRFHVQWVGGIAPFQVVLKGPNGQQVAKLRAVDERSASFDVGLGLGKYRLEIKDATGDTAEGVLEAVNAGPTIPPEARDLPPDVQDVLHAARLATVEHSTWRLDAYEAMASAGDRNRAAHALAEQLARGARLAGQTER